MPRHKSLLMAYMHRKHRHHAEGAAALLVLTIFAVLVMTLTVTNATGAATYFSERSELFDSQYYSDQSYPSTGLATGQSAAFVAMWLLALVLLVPLELSIRKKSN